MCLGSERPTQDTQPDSSCWVFMLRNDGLYENMVVSLAGPKSVLFCLALCMSLSVKLDSKCCDYGGLGKKGAVMIPMAAMSGVFLTFL